MRKFSCFITSSAVPIACLPLASSSDSFSISRSLNLDSHNAIVTLWLLTIQLYTIIITMHQRQCPLYLRPCIYRCHTNWIHRHHIYSTFTSNTQAHIYEKFIYLALGNTFVAADVLLTVIWAIHRLSYIYKPKIITDNRSVVFTSHVSKMNHILCPFIISVKLVKNWRIVWLLGSYQSDTPTVLNMFLPCSLLTDQYITTP